MTKMELAALWDKIKGHFVSKSDYKELEAKIEGLETSMNKVIGDRVKAQYEALLNHFNHTIQTMNLFVLTSSLYELPNGQALVPEANKIYILQSGDDYVPYIAKFHDLGVPGSYEWVKLFEKEKSVEEYQSELATLRENMQDLDNHIEGKLKALRNSLGCAIVKNAKSIKELQVTPDPIPDASGLNRGLMTPEHFKMLTALWNWLVVDDENVDAEFSIAELRNYVERTNPNLAKHHG